MRIEFNVTGAKRKELAASLSELMDMPAEYQYMPTCAYKIGEFTVAKDGALGFEEPLTEEQLRKLVEFLASRGFSAKSLSEEIKEKAEVSENVNAENEDIMEVLEATETSDAEATDEATVNAAEVLEDATEEAKPTEVEEMSAEADSTPQSENLGLTIGFSLDTVMVNNLTKLIEAKGGLIKKALNLDALPIEVAEDKVNFPWWNTMPEDFEEITAYTNFLAALCKMSKVQKRITAKEKAVDNEKYAFRCFLLRLGFIGAEYRKDRKILLKNLTGSSAFKATKEAADDEISE